MNLITRRRFTSSLAGLIAGGITTLPRARARGNHTLLKIRVGSSIFSGIKIGQARTIIKPVASLIAERANCDLDFGIPTVARKEDLYALGQALLRGEIHVAGIWGLEAGWLKKEYPGLQILVSAQYPKESNRSVIYARKGAFANLGALQGKIIAQYAKLSLMEELYTGELLRSQSFLPSRFFRLSPQIYVNAKSAIKAIEAGKADCGIVDAVTYQNLQEDAPSLLGHLQIVAQTADYPPPAVVANRERIEELRPGLWQVLRDVMTGIGSDAQGQELIRKWRVRAFEEPNERNQEKIRDAVNRFTQAIYDHQILPARPLTA